jgi:HEAT repeat protein
MHTWSEFKGTSINDHSLRRPLSSIVFRRGKRRDEALLALSAIGDERAIHPIVETWTDGCLSPLEHALVQLADRQRCQVLDEVISLLKHDKVSVRRNAMYCLRSLRAEESVSVLV